MPSPEIATSIYQGDQHQESPKKINSHVRDATSKKGGRNSTILQAKASAANALDFRHPNAYSKSQQYIRRILAIIFTISTIYQELIP